MTFVTDKERILMGIICELRSGMPINAMFDLARKGGPSYGAWFDVEDDDHYEIQPGTIVLARTSGVHPFTVGEFIEPLPRSYGGALVRELGGTRTCNISNDSFVPIKGVRAKYLLEGVQYKFREKVLKAFRRGDEYVYYFGGVDFIGGSSGREADIWIREKWGGTGVFRTKPFACRMKFKAKTTIKAILEAMVEAGYGTREFDVDHVEVYNKTTCGHDKIHQHELESVSEYNTGTEVGIEYRLTDGRVLRGRHDHEPSRLSVIAYLNKWIEEGR